jgi:hypothetical protein
LTGLAILTFVMFAAVGFYSKMGIVNFASGHDSLAGGLSKTFLFTAPVLIPIELGPAIFFALYLFVRRKEPFEEYRNDIFPLIYMLAIGFIGMFFIHHSTENVLVLRKSVMIIQIPLWLFSGMLFERSLPGLRFRDPSFVLMASLMLLSMQTSVSDIRTFSAWNNPKLTAYVSQADYAACRWIIENTPSDAVIQSWISYRSGPEDSEGSTYSIIPEFAERPTAVGIWEIAWYSRAEDDTPGSRWKDIRDTLFRGNDAYAAWEVAQKYNIDYLYIGPYEKNQAPEGCEKFNKSRILFEKVYAKEDINIFEVRSQKNESSVGTEVLPSLPR